MRQKDREKEKKGRDEKGRKEGKREGKGIHFCLRVGSSYLSERLERAGSHLRGTEHLSGSRHRSWCV